MNIFYWLAGIYAGCVVIDTANVIIAKCIETKKFKKENYEISNKNKFFKEIFKEIGVSFIPFINMAIFISYPTSFKEFYLIDKQKYISDGIIIDKEQLRLQQENAIIKEHKFKAAREELMNNKINTFETLEDYQKIEIIKNERKNIEQGIENNELGTSYNNLTNKEKIEFLNLLRDEVIANHQFQTTKNNKMKRKKYYEK
ncbi:MAG: hypothetical protein ACI4OT_00865 [Bacilli bacterium]